jgi:hypothetical protein
MKRIFSSLSVSVLFAGICVAQAAQSQATGTASQDTSATASQSGAQAVSNTSAAASQATTASMNKQAQVASASQLQAGSIMQAELMKPLDARKNKPGDEVIAKTTQDVKSEGHVVVPKGSKLMGHVTEVKSQSKDQAGSALGIAFDRALLKNGTEIPVSLTVQAIGRAQAAATAGAADSDTMAGGGAGGMGSSGGHASGGGLINGVASTTGHVVNTVGNTAGAAVNTAGATAGSVESGSLTSTSQGVVGLHGLSLAADASSSTHGSVITSKGGNVHLDSGTEMILRVNQ